MCLVSSRTTPYINIHSTRHNHDMTRGMAPIITRNSL